MASVNKVFLVGNIGSDPEVKTMQSGDKVANFTVATSESWKDKATGERKERTEWHRVVIFNQNLVTVAENYLKKGSKVYIEGQIETRNYEKDGQKIYTTEIVLRPYRGEIVMLDSKGDKTEQKEQKEPEKPKSYDLDSDSIPFMRLIANQIAGW